MYLTDSVSRDHRALSTGCVPAGFAHLRSTRGYIPSPLPGLYPSCESSEEDTIPHNGLSNLPAVGLRVKLWQIADASPRVGGKLPRSFSKEDSPL